ncbi:HAF repeat-containing protein [Isosphaeraceae bacterium EP7]
MPIVMLLLLAAAPVAAPPQAGDNVFRVASPKDDGIIATGINARGDVVGFEWAEDPKTPGIVAQVPFFASAGRQVTLPLLPGYTSTFPAAVSESGLVVGRVSKPASFNTVIHLRNQAFAWDEAKGMRGLGALPGDSASIACGISRDGRRVSGFSIGDRRVRACLWEPKGDEWAVIPLLHNEQLGAQVVAISDDGNRVTSVDGAIPCLWTRDAKGAWTYQAIGGVGEFLPRAVNNAGTVVGFHDNGDGTADAVISPRNGRNKTLPKPPGYPRAEAYALNNSGAIVGMIDGPRGSDVGPNAFVYIGGRLRILVECGPDFVTATAINDQNQVAGVLDKEEVPEPPAEPDKPAAPAPKP